MILAKAKSGYTAATTKDHKTVQSSWKNILTLLVLVAIATFAQIKFEAVGTTVITNAANLATKQGRSLYANVNDNDDLPFTDALAKNVNKWKQSHLQTKNTKPITKSTKPITKSYAPQFATSKILK